MTSNHDAAARERTCCARCNLPIEPWEMTTHGQWPSDKGKVRDFHVACFDAEKKAQGRLPLTAWTSSPIAQWNGDVAKLIDQMRQDFGFALDKLRRELTTPTSSDTETVTFTETDKPIIERVAKHLASGTCRRCSECEGMSHHWIADPRDPTEGDWKPGDYACKHCEVRGDGCENCDDDGCPACNYECVIPLGAEPPSEPAERPTDLHQAIMNIRIGSKVNVNAYGAYELGHRDARHAAAELALSHVSSLQQRLAASERELSAAVEHYQRWLNMIDEMLPERVRYSGDLMHCVACAIEDLNVKLAASERRCEAMEPLCFDLTGVYYDQIWHWWNQQFPGKDMEVSRLVVELWRIVMVSEEGLPSPDSEGLWHDGEKFWVIVEFGDYFAGYSLNRIGIAGHLLESLPQHRHWHRAVPSSKVAALVEREYPKMIESGDLVPSGHVILWFNSSGGWGIQKGPMVELCGLLYCDYGPLPQPETDR